mmetsp:Transcript_13856/g.18546  ORF Transcript_13856/g.18546 Transcript_13856/m.18546 type:complete len:342 (+) Transcript_13856:340-1365(+)
MIVKNKVSLTGKRIIHPVIVFLSFFVGATRCNNVREGTAIKLEKSLKESSQQNISMPTPPHAGVEVSFDVEHRKHNVRSRSKHGARDFSTDDLIAEERITDGELAELDEFPFYALLIGEYNGQYYSKGCGATLIEDEWILTAGHCNVQSGDIAWIGAVNAASQRERAVIENCYVHPDFSWPDPKTKNPPTYDFQLCRLTETSSMPKVRLAEADRILRDRTLTVIGMGAEVDGGRSTFMLSKAEVPFQPKNVCSATYPRDFMPDNMLCAGGGSKDACRGDSGGPLLDYVSTQFIQVGIVSFGYGCGVDGYYGVYADVRTQRAWIDRVICQNSSNRATPSMCR